MEPQYVLYLVAWVLLASASLVFWAFCCFQKYGRLRNHSLIGLTFLLMLATAGLVRVWQPHPSVNTTHFSRMKSTLLIGQVIDEPILKGRYIRMVLSITHCYYGDSIARGSGKMMLNVNTDDSLTQSPFRYGDELVIPAVYKQISPPYNPGEMNYKQYLASKDIWHRANIPFYKVLKTSTDNGNPIIAYALGLRQRLVSKFARNLSSRDAISIASTLILGYRATLDRDLLKKFSATGTIHILSVSGMHVVIVYWLFAKALIWMKRWKWLWIIRCSLLLIAVWGYALLTGFSPAVLRASSMMSFVILATAFGRQQQLYNSLAASAFILLFLEPKLIVDIGFQLSYLAVAGMMFLMSELQLSVIIHNVYVRRMVDYLLLSIAAQAGAGPLAAYHFHQFPLFFLPANLLVVLPATLIMYMGFALLIFPQGVWSGWIGQLLEWLIIRMQDVLFNIAEWPMAQISGISMTWWEVVLVYVALIMFVLAWSKRKKRLLYGTIVCLQVVGLSFFMTRLNRIGRHQIVAFNIGRHVALGFIGTDKAWLYTDLPSMNHSAVEYSVLPALESYVSPNRIRFIPSHNRYQDLYMYAQSNILQFGDKRVLVYEPDNAYVGKLNANILLLRNNPRLQPDELLDRFPCDQLILDASNDDETISRFTTEARKVGISVYVLKSNFAYVWPEEFK